MPNQGKVAGFYSPSHSGTYAKSLPYDGVCLPPSPLRGAASLTNEQMLATPVYVGATGQTIESLTVKVDSAGEAGSVIRLGVYAPGSDGDPEALLLDAGTVASDSTGEKKLTTELSVSAQWIWVTSVQQGAPSTPCDAVVADGWMPGTRIVNATHFLSFSTYYNAARRDDISGALPDPFGNATTGRSAAAVVVEV